MDVNVNISTEIELPGKVFVELIIELLGKFGTAAVPMLGESNVFIFKPDEEAIPFLMIMPSCTCENCTELKSKLKVMIRKGNMDKNEIAQLIEMLKHNDD